jgi:hypothetical protein
MSHDDDFSWWGAGCTLLAFPIVAVLLALTVRFGEWILALLDRVSVSFR